MSITRLFLLACLSSVFGCSAKNCAPLGCLNIDTPHFGSGNYAHSVDSVFLKKIEIGALDCSKLPETLCRDGLDSLFGAAAFIEGRDESGILRSDTIWFYSGKFFGGKRKEFLTLTRSNPGLWILEGHWSRPSNDSCRFDGREPGDPRNSVIRSSCAFFPPWILIDSDSGRSP